MFDSLIQSAVAYAHIGWAVFPVHSPLLSGKCSCRRPDCDKVGKHPRIGNWGSVRPSDVGAMEFWKKFPDANIGIVTGSVSKLVVIDVDGEKGKQSLKSLEEQHGALPATFTVSTGRGKHFYFKRPEAGAKTGASSVAPGIDVRGDGGYVIAPPSLHSSGKRYSIETHVKLAELPEWLALTVAPTVNSKALVPARSVELGSAEESVLVPSAEIFEVGSRNMDLTAAAGWFRRGGMTGEQINSILQLINDSISVGLHPKEVERIALSIGDRPVASLGEKPRQMYWFKVEVDHFLSDRNFRRLTAEQRGWLFTLMMECWKSGGTLPVDPTELADLAGESDCNRFSNKSAPVFAHFRRKEFLGRAIYYHEALLNKYILGVFEGIRKSKAGKSSGRARATDNND